MTTSRRWPSAKRARKNGIEAVAIVTPNHMHAPAARAFLKRRHPRDLRQAADRDAGARRRSSPKLAAESDALFVLTHNYTGYPMVRQARAMVPAGELGDDPRGPGRILRRTG